MSFVLVKVVEKHEYTLVKGLVLNESLDANWSYVHTPSLFTRTELRE